MQGGPFACDASAIAAPSPGWSRLSKRQITRTLADLLRRTLADEAIASSAFDALASQLDLLPEEQRKKLPQDLHGSYRRLDQDVSQAYVEATYELALEVGRLLSDSSRIASALGTCAADTDATNDEVCLREFVQRFGGLALRRPLSTDEVDFYLGFYGLSPGVAPEGVADVIAGILSAPQFLYLVEHGGAETNPDEPQELDAFELASRLSYHFWDTMPDQELWDAAASGALADPGPYREQVERLFADPRTRETTREFYRDWLKLEDVPAMDTLNDQPVFKAFAGPNLPSSELRGQMIDEVLDLVQHHTWDDPSGFDALLSSELSFARTQELADLYGIPVHVDGAEPTRFPAGQRPGMLTRAAFVATGSANTRPIMKGVFIRTNMLCDPIPPPPDNAASNSTEPTDTAGTREVVEALTEQPGSACAGCHATLINPLGFATEDFDGLGRWREVQRLFDAEGNETGAAPIDTSTMPNVVPGDETPSAGAQDLMRLILDSGKAQACMARHYFRFTFGRWEDDEKDGCALDQLWRALGQGGSIATMLREAALAPEFRQRLFTE